MRRRIFGRRRTTEGTRCSARQLAAEVDAGTMETAEAAHQAKVGDPRHGIDRLAFWLGLPADALERLAVMRQGPIAGEIVATAEPEPAPPRSRLVPLPLELAPHSYRDAVRVRLTVPDGETLR